MSFILCFLGWCHFCRKNKFCHKFTSFVTMEWLKDFYIIITLFYWNIFWFWFLKLLKLLCELPKVPKIFWAILLLIPRIARKKLIFPRSLYIPASLQKHSKTSIENWHQEIQPKLPKSSTGAYCLLSVNTTPSDINSSF